MPNVSRFGAQTDNAVVSGTVTDRQMIIPEVPPQGLMSVGPRVTPNFIKEPWSKLRSYNFFDVVKDVAGSSYIAIKPVVPTNTELTDEEFWFKWSEPNAELYELQEIVRTYEQRIALTVKTFPSVYEMKASPLTANGDIVMTEGRDTANDGGAAYYEITSDGVPNDVTVFRLQNNLVATLIITGNEIAAEALGINTTNIDNATPFENAQKHISGATIKFTAGTYKFTRGIHVANGIKLKGANSNRIGKFDAATVLDFSKAAASCAVQITGTVRDTDAFAEFPNRYKGTDIDNGIISISQCNGIKDIVILGSENIEAGVYLCGCLNSTFENVTINTFKNGLLMRTSWYNTFVNVCARNINYIALECGNDTDQNVFSNCGFSNTDESASQFNDPLTSKSIDPCVCYFSLAYGPYFNMLDTFTKNQNASHIFINDARCITIGNLFAEGNAKYVINLKSAICISVGNVWEYNTALQAFIRASGYCELTIDSIIGSKKIIDPADDFSALSKIVFTNPIRLASSAIPGVYNNPYEIANIHELYVDALNGTDTNTGTTQSNAFKTLDAAIKMANKYIKEHVTINVANGSYNMTVKSDVDAILSLKSDTTLSVNNYQISNLLEIKNGKLTAPDATNFFNVINNASVKIINTAIELNENQNLFNSYEQAFVKALFTNATVTGTGYLFNSSIMLLALYNTNKTITQTVKHNNVKLITVS